MRLPGETPNTPHSRCDVQGSGYAPGDPWAICDRSGFKVRRSNTVKEWNGLVVDRRFSEDRHPQDFVRSVPERRPFPDSRPDSEPVFLAVGDVTEDDL